MRLHELAEGGDIPSIDIVAVHGLNFKGRNVQRHAWHTWTSTGRQGVPDHVWLRDALPRKLPAARIMLYEYNSMAIGAQNGNIGDEANSLLECLQNVRCNDPMRPLILVGHSLGGLLIKQALINSKLNSSYGDIATAVVSLVFFGTPHNGGNEGLIQLAETASKIAQVLGFGANESIVQVLKRGSLFAETLSENFRHQLENYKILSFWEGRRTLPLGTTIVSKDSATFGLGGSHEHVIRLDADHHRICKFHPQDETDLNNYIIVEANFLRLYREILEEKSAQIAENRRGLLSNPNLTQIAQDGAILNSYAELVICQRSIAKRLSNKQGSAENIAWLTNTSPYRKWIRSVTSDSESNTLLVRQSPSAQATGLSLLSYLEQKERWRNVLYVDCQQDILYPQLFCFSGYTGVDSCDRAFWSLLAQGYCLRFEKETFSSFITTNRGFYNQLADVALTSSITEKILESFGSTLLTNRPYGGTVILDQVDSRLVYKLGKVLTRTRASNTSSYSSPMKFVLVGSDIQSSVGNFIDSNTEYSEFLKSLEASNFQQREDIVRPFVLTADHWILTDYDYCEWERSPSKWLFISGKPGSGKSTITKAIERRLSAMQGPNEEMELVADSLEMSKHARKKQTTQFTVASWYCSSKDEHTVRGHMFKSLLYQILHQDPTLFQDIRSVYRQDNDSANIWSADRTMAALEMCCDKTTKRIFFIIDGLDLPIMENAKPSRLERISCLQKLRQGIKPVNVLFSSRSVDDIAISTVIVLNERNRQDVERIVSTGMEQISSAFSLSELDDSYSKHRFVTDYTITNPSSTLHGGFDTYFKKAEEQNKKELKRLGDLMVHNAKGVILWVTTTLKILQERCDEPFIDMSELMDMVGDIPHGELNDLYCHIVNGLLEKLKPEKIALCRQALMWTAVGAGHVGFSLQHLLEVLVTIESPGRVFGFTSWISFKDHLRRLCGSLIEIVKPNGWSRLHEYHHFDEVQLIHPTVLSFLQDRSLARDLSFTIKEAKKNFVDKAKIYAAKTLPAEPVGEDPLPFPIRMPNKARTNVLLSYLETKPLLSYIIENISDAKSIVPRRYRFILLEFSDPSNLEEFFSIACSNGCLNAINAIFQMSSLEIEASEWYKLERPIVRAATLVAMKRHLAPQVQLLLSYFNRRRLSIGDILTREELEALGYHIEGSNLHVPVEVGLPIRLVTGRSMGGQEDPSAEIGRLRQETSRHPFGENSRTAFAINEIITFWFNLGMMEGKLTIGNDADLSQFLHLVDRAGMKHA